MTILAVVGESMAVALFVFFISTLAYGTGLIGQKNVVKVGLIVGAVSLLLGYGVLFFLGTNGLL